MSPGVASRCLAGDLRIDPGRKRRSRRYRRTGARDAAQPGSDACQVPAHSWRHLVVLSRRDRLDRDAHTSHAPDDHRLLITQPALARNRGAMQQTPDVAVRPPDPAKRQGAGRVCRRSQRGRRLVRSCGSPTASRSSRPPSTSGSHATPKRQRAAGPARPNRARRARRSRRGRRAGRSRRAAGGG